MSTEIIEKSRSFSEKLFSNNIRLSGNSYYEHACKVYDILVKNSVKDELTLAASLLHPLCDLNVFDEKIVEKEFGPEITQILKNYVHLKKSKIDKETPRAYNEAFFIQAFFKLSKDMRTLVNRLADKLENLNTSFALKPELRIRAAQKVLYLYSVVAKTVGFRGISNDMENEAFRILKPREYKLLVKSLNIKIHETRSSLEDAHHYIKEILEENEIDAEVTYRYKTIYSIYRKLLLKNLIDKNFIDEIKILNDIAAMRVVVNTVDECYKVEELLNETWDSNINLRKDYIQKPRNSGYKSIHLNYKISKRLNAEIQIRTHEMHEYNEFGPASHLLYKIGDKGYSSLAYKKLLIYTNDNKYWFKDLNLQHMESLDIEAHTKIPFAKQIYCFTPKGDILELPTDASLVDFAYALHTDMGNKCAGGYVNGQYATLDHKLKDGDMVEIKTMKKNNVNQDWLKFVKSTRTRAHIRKALHLTK